MSETAAKIAPTARPRRGVPGNERMNAFSDGVFAIAITLLALELRVPEQLPAEGLAGVLPELLPKLAGHVVTFVVVGVYWIGHHNLFLHIPRHDRVLLWLNLMFLMFVAAMPFFGGLMLSHREDSLALALYGANLAAIGFSLELSWWYASSNGLIDDIDPHVVTFVHRYILLAPVLFVVAIGLSFISQPAATVLVVVVPLLYMIPGRIDRHHHGRLGVGADASISNSSERGFE